MDKSKDRGDPRYSLLWLDARSSVFIFLIGKGKGGSVGNAWSLVVSTLLIESRKLLCAAHFSLLKKER